MSCLSRPDGMMCALPLALCVLGSLAPARAADRSRERASELLRRRLALWKGDAPPKGKSGEAEAKDFDLSTRNGQLRAYAQYKYRDDDATPAKRRRLDVRDDDGEEDRAAAVMLIRSACRRKPPFAFIGSWTLANVGAIDDALVTSPSAGSMGPACWLLVGGIRGYFSATAAFDEPMWLAVKQVANGLPGRELHR